MCPRSPLCPNHQHISHKHLRSLLIDHHPQPNQLTILPNPLTIHPNPLTTHPNLNHQSTIHPNHKQSHQLMVHPSSPPTRDPHLHPRNPPTTLASPALSQDQ